MAQALTLGILLWGGHPNPLSWVFFLEPIRTAMGYLHLRDIQVRSPALARGKGAVCGFAMLSLLSWQKSLGSGERGLGNRLLAMVPHSNARAITRTTFFLTGQFQASISRFCRVLFNGHSFGRTMAQESGDLGVSF